MLKSKNLKIQVLINVLDDNDSKALDESDLKIKSVISEQIESSEQFESSEEISINELEEQFFVIYFYDEWIYIIVTALRDDQRKLKEFLLAKCTLRNDRIYYKNRLLILEDEELRLRLLQLSHDTSIASHSNKVKIYEILSHHYYWLEMIESIAHFICNCHLYFRVKVSREKYQRALKSLDVFNHCWKDIVMNFIMKLSESKNLNENSIINIMIVVNKLFKQVHYKFMNEITALDTAWVFYRSVWKHHKLSNLIILNRKTQFINHFWNELCTRLKIQTRLSTAFHLKINDQIKNANDVLKQYFRIFVFFLQNDWAAWLSSAEFIINNHFFKSTQCMSFLLEPCLESNHTAAR